MEQQKVDAYIAANSKFFKPEAIPQLTEMLKKADDTKFNAVQSTQLKDPTMILIMAILLGGLGVDRFMLGQTGLGIAKLLTAGGCYLWALIDMFTAMGRARDKNMAAVQAMLA